MAPAVADNELSTSSSPSPPPPTVLVVFDFDQSLVDDDSDIFVFQQLQPELLRVLQDRWSRVQWTQLIDELLQQLARARPDVSAAAIEATLARIPVHPHMLDAVRLAAQDHGAHVHIVSDANTVFIQSMLEHHGLTSLVRRVHSNPAHFEQVVGSDSISDVNGRSNRLRVTRYHGAHLPPHDCPHCPVNMCKGAILDAVRREHAFTHVLYVGDGKGDFCPVTRLASHDVVFAREGKDPYRGPFELLPKIQEHRADVLARVVPWRTGDDILAHFREFFKTSDIAAAAAQAVP